MATRKGREPITKGSSPPYYKHGEEAVLQAKIEELERQNIVAKVSDLGIQLRYASPSLSSIPSNRFIVFLYYLPMY